MFFKDKIKANDSSLQSIMEVLPIGVISTDFSGKIIFVNEYLASLFEYSKEELIGKEVEELIPFNLREKHIQYRNEYFKNPVQKSMGENRVLKGLTRSGKTIYLEIGLRPFEYNNEKNLIIVINDVTEMNKVFNKLEVTNKQLEEYAFLVSHDLRAPVRHISNFVELLNDELKSQNTESEKIEKYIGIIQNNSNKIQNMISGMLKIASINQVKPYITEIDLAKLLEAEAKSYEEKLKLELVNLQNFKINSDKELLKQIFNNLFQNSIRFCNTDSANVTISLTKNDGEIDIEYSDNGIGIERSIAEKLFTPFIKSQESNGLGLGMTIVKRSLRVLKGDISCIPSDEGALFKIVFH